MFAYYSHIASSFHPILCLSHTQRVEPHPRSCDLKLATSLTTYPNGSMASLVPSLYNRSSGETKIFSGGSNRYSKSEKEIKSHAIDYSPSGFNVDSVLFELQKVSFPAEKWQSLANGLTIASAVPIIEADQRTVVGKL